MAQAQEVQKQQQQTIDPNQVRTLPIELIKATDNVGRPKSIRREAEAEGQNLDSIKSVGILQPLIVGPRNDDGTYPLLDGFRRLSKAKELKISRVPVHVVDSKKISAENVARLANLARKELDPYQKALVYKQMTDEGMNKLAIAKLVGVHHSVITNHLQLLSLQPQEQRDIIGGFWTFGAALDIGKIRESVNPEVAQRIKELAEKKAQAEKDKKAKEAQAAKLKQGGYPKVGKDSTKAKGKQSDAVQKRHVEEAAAEVAKSDPKAKEALARTGGVGKKAVAKMDVRDIDAFKVVLATHFEETDKPALEAYAMLFSQWADGSIDGEVFAAQFEESFGLYESEDGGADGGADADGDEG